VYTAVVFLPLLGALVVGLFGRLMGDRASQYITSGLLIISVVLAWFILYDVAFAKTGPAPFALFDWISVGSLKIQWALRFDTLSAVMVFVVTLVSAVVHVYSIGYMRHDPGIPRFFAYLSLFTFAMLMLVTAENFVQMFFGWEGVGLCSYFLIGYWYERESANAAAIKAFVMNRVGDFGFLLGMFLTFAMFGALDFANVLPAAATVPGKTITLVGGWSVDGQTALNWACVLLFIGAMGKSAQIFLHTWLPDAMEGPTPVSALIHAATMVTAGVFMVCRLSPMFEFAPAALAMVVIVGGFTAFFAASIGLVQNDIKRVIAYSTCSQLGYMFFAAGVGAFPAAIFHLMTHAFFKALLFLGSGSVIHGMSDEQDMRRMGGLWRKMKVTYVMMWIGSLALGGIPIFAGYYSKDMIIESAFAAHTGLGLFAYWMGIAAAVMTAFYSWRLLLMTFHGKPRASAEVMSHVHESPPVMTIPLGVLAIGATFAGMVAFGWFVGEHWKTFWGTSIYLRPSNHVMENAHHIPGWAAHLAIVVGLAGIVIAYLMYMAFPGWPRALAKRLRGLYFFLLNKWYFDELYDALFVRPAFRIGRGLWRGGDGAVIDGLGPDGVASVTRDTARRIAGLQTGYLYHYAFAILAGVAVFLSLYLFGVVG
jgi:NADH-quinone oxidoreductase subunit L